MTNGSDIEIETIGRFIAAIKDERTAELDVRAWNRVGAYAMDLLEEATRKADVATIMAGLPPEDPTLTA